MKLTDEQYFAVVKRAYEAFRDLPNVHTVGIGGRERAGSPVAGDAVLKVFVSRKRPASELQPSELVPAEFEGVETDVVEMPVGRESLLAPTGIPLHSAYPEDETRYRPLKGGIQIMPGNQRDKGTLGFFARVTGDQRIMAVTCKHVLFPKGMAPEPKMRVGNPTPDDSFTKCCQGAFSTFVVSHYDADVDAAIAELDPSTEWLAEIEGIGIVIGQHDITVDEAKSHTYQVRKRGRTTGLTGGTVQAIGAHGATEEGRTYTNGITVRPNPDSSGKTLTFADSGDSGAALLNAGNEIVGLLFTAHIPKDADTNPDATTGWGTAFPIADLLAKFKDDQITLEVAKTTKYADVQKTPAAAGESPRARVIQSPIAGRVETDLNQTERGRALTALWLRRSRELNQLVNTNRRIAVRWRRAGGAAIFQHVLRAAQSPDYVFPERIEGRPLDDCISEIVALFSEHGDETLRRDLQSGRALLPPIAGRTYRQIVDALHEQGALMANIHG